MNSTPLVNALLLAVAPAGGSDTFEGPPIPAPAKWEGRAGVWLEERRERRRGEGGGSDVIIRRELTVSSSLPIAWTDGDTVTLERTGDRRQATGTVAVLEGPVPPRGEQGETHLAFEPA